MADTANLPRWQSHKIVHAAPIVKVEGDIITLDVGLPGGHDDVRAAPNMFARYMPVPGDYYVVYDDGYASISPKKAFDAGYHRPEDERGGPKGIGWAVKQMQSGYRVRRAGWNGKGMFVVLMPELQLPPYSTQGTERKVNDRTAKWIGEDQPLNCCPYVAMFNAAKEWQPGWVCSQPDLLAMDWEMAE